MSMRIKSKKILTAVLAANVIISCIPSFGITAAYAAQSNEYTDPADVWIEANGRMNEFDINATTTSETYYCPICEMDTLFTTYRVPEYTRSGSTALNRNVQFSDGTMIDRVNKGNLDDGTPGIDAFYSGYSFTDAAASSCTNPEKPDTAPTAKRRLSIYRHWNESAGSGIRRKTADYIGV